MCIFNVLYIAEACADYDHPLGHLSTIVVYDINPEPTSQQPTEHSLRIVCEDSKATVAGFSYLAHYIIAGHEDGTVSQFDGKSGELLFNTQAHEPDMLSE